MKWVWTSSRRGLLRQAGMLSAAVSGLAGASSSALAGAARWVGSQKSVYRELGVRPLINAAGTYTALSASLLPPPVVRAMEEAARFHAPIPELQAAVGKRIAALTGAEYALVTSGAAAALLQATAACVAGKDPEKIRRIPDITGLKSEVIVQKAHRVAYEHAIRNVGVRMVEVETRAQLEQAISERTAMMFFLNFADPKGQVKRREFVEIARRAGIPTLLDAAADVPPQGRLQEYVRMGFDLVVFSGGKGLRGPQCSGLLLGRRELVEAAYLNGSPHADSVGRGCKVGKEEIVGLWKAVEYYMQKDHRAEWREWESRIAYIAAQVASIPGVKTETFVPEIANEVPHLRISWTEDRIPMKNAQAADLLRKGEPRIEVRPSDGKLPNLEIGVWMLAPGEHKLVAAAVRQLLLQQSRKG